MTRPIYSTDRLDPADRPPGDVRAAAGLLRLLRDPPPAASTEDRYEQSRHFVGVVYIAVSAIMRAMAGASVVVVKRRKKKTHKTTFGPGGRVAKAMPTPHAQGSDERFAPCDDHPLSDLMGPNLERPNPSESMSSVLEYLTMQVKLTGTGPVWGVPNGFGCPVEVYALPAAAVSPAYGASPAYPSGAWRVNPHHGGGLWGFLGNRHNINFTNAIIPNGELSRLVLHHPWLTWDGYSPLAAGAVQLDILEAIDQARWSAMQNGLTPDAVLVLPGFDQEQLDRFTDKFQERNAGSRNHRRMVALAPPIGSDKGFFQSMGGSVKDMDFSGGWDQMVKNALALFGVPPVMAGLDSAGSYAAVYAALKQFHTNVLSYDAKRIGDFLTRVLFGWCKDADRYKVQIDLPKIDDQDQLGAQIGRGNTAGTLTYNESRRLEGWPPVEGGDIPVAIYMKILEQKLMPQQPAGMPGMPGGGDGGGQPPGGDQSPPGGEAPPGAGDAGDAGGGVPTDSTPEGQPGDAGGEADPLAAMLGGAGEQAPGMDDEEGVKSSAVQAALRALGVSADGGAVVRKGEARAEGSVWTAASGTKYTKRGGKITEYHAPRGGKGKAAAQPPLASLAHNPNTHLIEHKDSGGAWHVNGDPANRVAAARGRLSAGELVSPFPGGKAGWLAAYGRAMDAGKAEPNQPPPRQPEPPPAPPASPPTNSTTQPKPAPQTPPPLPQRAAFKTAVQTHAAPLKAVADEPHARVVFDAAPGWAGEKAKAHAAAVAKHFGIPYEKAHAILVKAILAVVAQARAGGNGGKLGNVIITDKRTGKRAELMGRAADKPGTGKPSGRLNAPAGPKPPTPPNKAGKGSLPPKMKAVPTDGGDDIVEKAEGMSTLTLADGGALVPPPDQPRRKKRKRLNKRQFAQLCKKALGVPTDSTRKAFDAAAHPRGAGGKFVSRGELAGVLAAHAGATGRAKEHIETALWNAGVEDPAAPPKKVERKLLYRRLASVYRDLHASGGSAADLDHVAGALRHAGATQNGTAGEVLPFDGAKHAADVGVSTGAPVRVTRAGWYLDEGDGHEYHALQAAVEPTGEAK